MTDLQKTKDTVSDYNIALDSAAPEALATVVGDHVARGYCWRGYQPFNQIDDADSVA